MCLINLLACGSISWDVCHRIIPWDWILLICIIIASRNWLFRTTSSPHSWIVMNSLCIFWQSRWLLLTTKVDGVPIPSSIRPVDCWDMDLCSEMYIMPHYKKSYGCFITDACYNAGKCQKACQGCPTRSSKKKRNEIFRSAEDWQEGSEALSWRYNCNCFILEPWSYIQKRCANTAGFRPKCLGALINHPLAYFCCLIMDTRKSILTELHWQSGRGTWVGIPRFN